MRCQLPRFGSVAVWLWGACVRCTVQRKPYYLGLPESPAFLHAFGAAAAAAAAAAVAAARGAAAGLEVGVARVQSAAGLATSTAGICSGAEGVVCRQPAACAVSLGETFFAFYCREWSVHFTCYWALATSHKGKSRVTAPVVTAPTTCAIVGLFQ